jgi:hypothetical protein
MKWILRTLICSLMLPVLVPSQTPQTGGAATSQTALPQNQELNIEAYTELLRADLRKNKSQVIGQVMQLDTDQATVFWPIYKEFEAEFAKNGDQVVDLVKKYVNNYDSMTDEIADQLAMQLLDIEQQRVALKRKYYQRFKAALDSVTAARFLQVENQIEKIADLQIASQLPVMGAGK